VRDGAGWRALPVVGVAPAGLMSSLAVEYVTKILIVTR
jgi:hypothetical protein